MPCCKELGCHAYVCYQQEGGFALEAVNARAGCNITLPGRCCCMRAACGDQCRQCPAAKKAGVPCTLVLPAAGGFALGAEDARGCDSGGFCEPVLSSVLHLLPDAVRLEHGEAFEL